MNHYSIDKLTILLWNKSLIISTNYLLPNKVMDTSGQFKELIDTLEDLTETVKHVGIIACDFEEQSQVPLILLYCLLSYIIY